MFRLETEGLINFLVRAQVVDGESLRRQQNLAPAAVKERYASLGMQISVLLTINMAEDAGLEAARHTAKKVTAVTTVRLSGELSSFRTVRA